jgi:hypothetical protein
MKMMPLAIILKKFNDGDENNICYNVELPYENKTFFIIIKLHVRTISYYQDKFFKNLIKEVKISNDSDAPFEFIESIEPCVTNFIAFHIYKALKNSYFPDIISKISS